MDNRKIWDNTYKTGDINDLPWNFEIIPDWFKNVISSGWVRSCKTLDIGCGLGNYANCLAQKGFNVTGIDFSSEAVNIAKEKYKNHNLEFKVSSILDLSDFENTKFEFIYDISLLHHIKPADRLTYVEQILSVSHVGTKFMLCCFSDKESFFEGKREFDNPETNTVTYPLSEMDIRELFSSNFKIEKIEKIKFGKSSDRERFLVLMEVV